MNGVINKSKLDVYDFRALKPITGSSIARAVAGKLIKDVKGTGVNGYKGGYVPQDDVLNRLSRQTATNIEDTEAIFQALPDTKIAMEIWSSCILNAKDGVTETLMWSVDTSETDYSAQLFTGMLDIIRDYFEKEYDIFQHLKPAVEDALFKTGSYPLVVVPESSLDDIINGRSAISNESLIQTLFKKDDEGYKVPSIGILGEPSKIRGVPNNRHKAVGIESMIFDYSVSKGTNHPQIHNGLTITDNPDVLKIRPSLQKTQKRRNRERIRQYYGIESYANVDLNLNDREAEQLLTSKDKSTNDSDRDRRFDTKLRDSVVNKLYKDRTYVPQKIVKVKPGKEASRLPSTHPLVLKIPSSAVIPIHTPGNPRDVVGAFIILDEFGNPLDSSRSTDLFSESRQNTKERLGQAQTIIKQMNFYTDGCFTLKATEENADENLNELARAYGSLLEEDLISRLANGLNGENIEIARADEIYRIMFARSLAAMRTQILYIPGDILTYFAFDYNRYGIGKSLLEDSRMIAAMRATMTYADLYANIMNSIGRRRLVVTLDDSTPDVTKAIETIRSEYMRANSWNMPLISEGPVDAVNVLRESAVDFVLEGESPALPATKVDVEDVTTSRSVPDENIRDYIKNIYISSLGLPPTSVDETQNIEYATTAIQSNALLNKRTLAYQDIFCTDFLYDFVVKYTLNSGSLIKQLSEEIKTNRDLLTDEQRALGTTLPIIEDFLDRINIRLPIPENMIAEKVKNDLDNYSQLLDSVLDGVLTDEVLAKALPDGLREETQIAKSVFKSILLNQYINENNILPSLRKLIDIDNTADTIEAEVKNGIEPIIKVVRLAVESMIDISNKNKSAKLTADGENDDSFGSSGYNDYSSDSAAFDTGSEVDSGVDDFSTDESSDDGTAAETGGSLLDDATDGGDETTQPTGDLGI